MHICFRVLTWLNQAGCYLSAAREWHLSCEHCSAVFLMTSCGRQLRDECTWLVKLTYCRKHEHDTETLHRFGTQSPAGVWVCYLLPYTQVRVAADDSTACQHYLKASCCQDGCTGCHDVTILSDHAIC